MIEGIYEERNGKKPDCYNGFFVPWFYRFLVLEFSLAWKWFLPRLFPNFSKYLPRYLSLTQKKAKKARCLHKILHEFL